MTHSEARAELHVMVDGFGNDWLADADSELDDMGYGIDQRPPSAGEVLKTILLVPAILVLAMIAIIVAIPLFALRLERYWWRWTRQQPPNPAVLRARLHSYIDTLDESGAATLLSLWLDEERLEDAPPGGAARAASSVGRASGRSCLCSSFCIEPASDHRERVSETNVCGVSETSRMPAYDGSRELRPPTPIRRG